MVGVKFSARVAVEVVEIGGEDMGMSVDEMESMGSPRQ